MSKEFYILGLPVKIAEGEIEPFKIVDYFDYAGDLSMMALTKNNIIYQYSKLNKDKSLDDLIAELQNMSLLEIILSVSDFRNSYFTIFRKCLGQDFSDIITEDNFMDIRKTILDMNCIPEEDASPNHEIQQALERSKRVKAQGKENSDMGDVISSIVAFTGINYSSVLDWTIYQVYMTYSRIAQFKNYDTTTLFATVPSESKVDIESWSKHIDLLQQDDHAIQGSEFDKNYGGLFS